MELTRRQLMATGLTAAGAAITSRAAIAAPQNHKAAAAKASAPPGGLIRLSGNENPYGPSERARRAIAGAIPAANRYVPEADRDALSAAIARRHGLGPEHVVLTAGSQALLGASAVAFASGREAVIADLTYSGMLACLSAVGAKLATVPMTAGWAHDLDAMERRVGAATALVYVCNPNNPTGTIVDGARLRAFCQVVSRRATVLVDEAYAEYVDDPRWASMIPLVAAGANVVVSRSFSKLYGLAGARVGYGLARPDLASRLADARMGSDLSVGVLGCVPRWPPTTTPRSSGRPVRVTQRCAAMRSPPCASSVWRPPRRKPTSSGSRSTARSTSWRKPWGSAA